MAGKRFVAYLKNSGDPAFLPVIFRFMILRIFLISLLATTVARAETCIQRQGALDIGSGSTKAFAAVIDTCQDRIVETLFERQIPIAFGEAVTGSGRGEIPADLVRKASAEIGALIKSMQEKKLTRISAIATSAFRSAKNGENAANEIGKRTKITVKVLSQEEEAEIGAVSARARGGISEKEARYVVWDIGGGSMQMWAKTKDGVQLFKGDLASVGFKNQVIREIQGKDPQKATSPNPLGDRYREAVKLAADHAKKNVPSFFKTAGAGTRWLGVGGVLALSVQKQVKNSATVFSRSELNEVLAKRAKLKDADIESDYRATEISNLALVLGYMEALNIEKVETIEVSLVQGWLLH